jgi:hypothetical protein
LVSNKRKKRRPGRVVAVGSSCYWTRLSRSRRLGSRGLLNPERADERESGQGLEIKKKQKSYSIFFSLHWKTTTICKNINFSGGFLFFHVIVILRALRYTLCQMLALIFVDTLRFREISNKIATKSYITKRNMIFIASREMLH